jgi:predicted solute-binding protein
MCMSKLRELMAEEDERVRSEIKECAYTADEESLQQRVQQVLDASKERQRRLFDLYWNKATPECT